MTNNFVRFILALSAFLAANVAFAQLGLADLELDSNENEVLYPDPGFDAARDVTFLLYTRANPEEGEVLTTSNVWTTNFISYQPTRIIIHGWVSDYASPVRAQLVDAFLSKGNFNVIFVNWGPGSRDYNYPLVRYRVQSVADVAVKFFNYFIRNYLIRRNEVLIAGHSLGAHIAGLIGKQIPGFYAIVGLDPAGPLFYGNPDSEKLTRTDANNVQVIHTSGATYGINAPIGNSDFYPNGGMIQPACNLNITCYHGIAFTYYAESLKGNNNFLAVPCGSLLEYRLGSCTDRNYLMGGDPLAYIPDGKYYLETNMWAPYGQG